MITGDGKSWKDGVDFHPIHSSAPLREKFCLIFFRSFKLTLSEEEEEEEEESISSGISNHYHNT